MILKAVIDASPLFSCLVANFNLLSIDRGLPSKYGSKLKAPFQSETGQRELLEAIGSIRQKLTTSHVIGELQDLQSSRLKLTNSELMSFWDASIDLLKQWSLDEQLIRLLDLSTDETFKAALGRIGPPDTGVVKLALDHNCVLITEDARALLGEASRAGVICRLPEHLISPRV